MKTILLLLPGILFAASASAEFRTWTRNDGKTAELELISVTESDGEKAGEFKTRGGQKVTLKSSVLSEADAKLLAEWKPETAAAPAGAASVFDDVLDGNLVKLSGKSLKPFKDLKKPSKYYLFYYTASWCGPCQKFTPALVDFYNQKKNGEFEAVLVSSDRDEDAMENYSVEKKMPWPQLKLSKVEKFKREFKHPGTGIPNLVLCDLEGKLIKTSYVDGKYIGPHAVMQHLETLLSK
jgi:thiol-disulfide isomerase/thioredoxin